MADSAVVRTSRALDLIPYIVKHPAVSIEELARAFNTTEYEISETLEIVFMCGLPGYTPLELIDLSKEDGYVSIIDPQNLNKPRSLQQIEVVSILLGLTNLKSQGVSAEVLEIVERVEKKLGQLVIDPGLLDSIEQPILIPGGEWRHDLESAIRSATCVEMDYTSIGKDERRTRRVWPQRIYTLGGKLYIEGYTPEGVVRHYRCDRIHSLTMIAEALPVQVTNESTDEIQIEALIPRSAQYFLESNSHIIETMEEIGLSRRVAITVSHSDWIIRALGSINGSVSITAPREISEAFLRFTQATLANYSEGV